MRKQSFTVCTREPFGPRLISCPERISPDLGLAMSVRRILFPSAESLWPLGCLRSTAEAKRKYDSVACHLADVDHKNEGRASAPGSTISASSVRAAVLIPLWAHAATPLQSWALWDCCKKSWQISSAEASSARSVPATTFACS